MKMVCLTVTLVFSSSYGFLEGESERERLGLCNNSGFFKSSLARVNIFFKALKTALPHYVSAWK